MTTVIPAQGFGGYFYGHILSTRRLALDLRNSVKRPLCRRIGTHWLAHSKRLRLAKPFRSSPPITAPQRVHNIRSQVDDN